MTTRKIIHTLFLSTFALALTVGVVACDEGDDDGGNAEGGDGDGDGDGCSFEDSQDQDCPAYTECALTNCDASYQTCFGADYMNGSFGGSCGDYMTCVTSCGCDDDTCQQTCYDNEVGMSGDCFDCLVMEIGGCVATSCSAELQECSGG